MEMTHDDQRLERILGPSGSQEEVFETKSPWHHGVYGDDGIVGYDTLRSDAPVKAAGRSPSGTINDAKAGGNCNSVVGLDHHRARQRF